MSDQITDAYDMYGPDARRAREAILHQHVRTRPGLLRVEINWEPRGQVYAEVNHSRWIARCPFCAGAMYVAPGLEFFCVDCLMAGNDGHAMRVVFPAERARIEALLAARPQRANRNWQPGESVEELEAENAAHLGGASWPG